MLPDLHIDPASIPAGEIPAVLSALAALQAALAARLMTPAAQVKVGADDSDTLLTVEETAARLRRSTKWVYRRVKNLPFARRLGPRSWVFSSAGLEKWIARQKP